VFKWSSKGLQEPFEGGLGKAETDLLSAWRPIALFVDVYVMFSSFRMD
jgi:hypothetical protein